MAHRRDSRECPGPISEATLHRPSPSRVLTAGAIALAVMGPALDSVEHAAEAVQAAPTLPESASPALDEETRTERPASRSNRADRTIGAANTENAEYATTETLAEWLTPETLAERAAAAVTETSNLAARLAKQAAAREAAILRWTAQRRKLAAERAAMAAQRREAAQRRVAEQQLAAARQTAATAGQAAGSGQARQVHRVRPVTTHRRTVVTKRAPVKRAQRVARLSGMTAVIAYARSQVGKRYVSGGSGPYGFDCSGFTKRAYEQAGIRLPHSSGAQAARARTISRSHARPGDLVVGPGHVGIYMGRGMMIDAGNSRTGVVYRKLYSGLRVARL